MYDVLGMHVLHTLTDLSHEDDACALRQDEVVVNDTVKQLPAQDTERYRSICLIESIPLGGRHSDPMMPGASHSCLVGGKFVKVRSQ